MAVRGPDRASRSKQIRIPPSETRRRREGKPILLARNGLIDPVPRRFTEIMSPCRGLKEFPSEKNSANDPQNGGAGVKLWPKTEEKGARRGYPGMF